MKIIFSFILTLTLFSVTLSMDTILQSSHNPFSNEPTPSASYKSWVSAYGPPLFFMGAGTSLMLFGYCKTGLTEPEIFLSYLAGGTTTLFGYCSSVFIQNSRRASEARKEAARIQAFPSTHYLNRTNS